MMNTNFYHLVKHSKKMLFTVFFVCVYIVSLQSSFAQQQQWSSQYIHWKFDANAKEIINIDQEVWIQKPNDKSFWPLQWSWENSNGVGGYMGLQQSNGLLEQNVRFSLWNAIDADVSGAPGAISRKFGGEGIGYTCELPFTINPDKFYRYRLWRLNEDTDGQWWGAWLIESDGKGKLIEHVIGKIKVPKMYKNVIDVNSISNFVEYYGPQQAKCITVPSSVVGFKPPSLNYRGNGEYTSYSVFDYSTKAEGNKCVNGNESTGALISVLNYSYRFAKGVLVLMGTPSELPDN